MLVAFFRSNGEFRFFDRRRHLLGHLREGGPQLSSGNFKSFSFLAMVLLKRDPSRAVQGRIRLVHLNIYFGQFSFRFNRRDSRIRRLVTV